MERTSYLKAEEVQAAQALHKRAPFALCNVSHGFFSIARHNGGLRFQDCDYTYIDGHDECIRDDVLKLVTKLRKEKGRTWLAELRKTNEQIDLYEGDTDA